MSHGAEQVFAQLAPTVWSVLLVSLRLSPIAFLCPLLGGAFAPSTVRLGVVLSLSLSLHLVGGVSAPHVENGWSLLAASFRELTLGSVIGFLAALPFELARTSGRLVDLLRGATAEAVLPGVGTRDSATGEALHQLLLALAASGPAMMLVVTAVWRSFGVTPLGVPIVGETVAMELCVLATGALATALALSGPVLGLTLAVDLTTGLLLRAAPSGGFRELSAPLKLLGGGAALWAGLGLIAQRLLEVLNDIVEPIHLFLERAP